MANAAKLGNWYGTARWQKLRARHLASEPLCRMCLEDKTLTAANVCDHIEPHNGDYDKFWSGPFQSLCKRHHDSDKKMIEAGRPKVRISLDGWPEGT